MDIVLINTFQNCTWLDQAACALREFSRVFPPSFSTEEEGLSPSDLWRQHLIHDRHSSFDLKHKQIEILMGGRRGFFSKTVVFLASFRAN